MGDTEFHFTPEACETLFPLVLAIDGDSRICHASEPLSQRLELNCVGMAFEDVFVVTRPRMQSISQASLLGHEKKLFLLHDRHQRFGMRGQVIAGRVDDRLVAILLLSPWVSWLRENRPDYRQHFTDFPAHDAQLDLDLQLQAMTNTLNQQKILVAELQAAREAADAANAAKTRFVSHITHELRTPLNGVIGSLELLDDFRLDEEAVSLLKTMRVSADILMATVDSVLDYARLSSGKIVMSTGPFEVRGLVAIVVDLLDTQARAAGMSLATHVDADVPDWVEGDSGKITQCLSNFVSNAIKYAARGRVLISVSLDPTVRTTESEVSLRFAVEDQGPGVPEQDRENLFVEFWIRQDLFNANVRSTGLGLSIVKRTIEFMGGQIGMRTPDTGVGSEFWFRLSLPRAVKPQPVCADPEENRPVVDTLPGRRVLVVDDNAVNRLVACTMLRKLGHTVDEAASGAAALDKMSSDRYDLILLDMQLTDMHGIEVMERYLAGRTGDGAGCRILAWSANTMEEDVKRYMAAGMDGWLPKPVTRKAIADALTKLSPTP